jgi:hypothetical protein
MPPGGSNCPGYVLIYFYLVEKTDNSSIKLVYIGDVFKGKMPA